MTRLTLSDDEPNRIEKHGPATSDELGGHPSLAERSKYDVLKFNPLSNYRAVWHTPTHNPETVVRTWVDANEDMLRAYDIGHRELTANLTDPYVDAWRRIRDEYEWLRKKRDQKDMSEHSRHACPLCGETNIQNLPKHMRGCDG